MAGDNSSLQEFLPRDARFQPADPGAIAEAIVRGLTDKPFRQRLLALADQRPPTWDDVADKAAVVFKELVRRSDRYRPGWRRRPQLALVGLPSALADAVSAYASVDRYEASPASTNGGITDGDAISKDGPREVRSDENGGSSEVVRLPLSALRKIDPWRGGYDAIVAWVPHGEERDAGVVERLASEWPGRVVALFDQTASVEAPFGDAPSEEAPGQATDDRRRAGTPGSPFRVPGARSLLVPDEPGNWEETARQVAEAAQGPAW
jgi:hypothetical protein